MTVYDILIKLPCSQEDYMEDLYGVCTPSADSILRLDSVYLDEID